MAVEIKIVEYKWNGRKYNAALIRCPHCNQLSVELYPVKFYVCEKCGKIADLRGIIFKDFKDGSEVIPVWEWENIRTRILTEVVG